MPIVRSPFASTLFALALLAAFALASPSASAQQRGGQPIEREMTPEEFKAAGLDKLSAEELARLNAWLGRKIDTVAAEVATQAAAQASEQTQQRIERENRGFFHFGSSEPIVARVVGEFRGFGKGREYALDNGQLWRQTDDVSLVGARMTAPEVRIAPALVGNVWYLSVQGFNKRAKVERIK